MGIGDWGLEFGVWGPGIGLGIDSSTHLLISTPSPVFSNQAIGLFLRPSSLRLLLSALSSPPPPFRPHSLRISGVGSLTRARSRDARSRRTLVNLRKIHNSTHNLNFIPRVPTFRTLSLPYSFSPQLPHLNEEPFHSNRHKGGTTGSSIHIHIDVGRLFPKKMLDGAADRGFRVNASSKTVHMYVSAYIIPIGEAWRKMDWEVDDVCAMDRFPRHALTCTYICTHLFLKYLVHMCVFLF